MKLNSFSKIIIIIALLISILLMGSYFLYINAQKKPHIDNPKQIINNNKPSQQVNNADRRISPPPAQF